MVAMTRRQLTLIMLRKLRTKKIGQHSRTLFQETYQPPAIIKLLAGYMQTKIFWKLPQKHGDGKCVSNLGF